MGMYKSERRLTAEKANLVSLLENNTLEQIADMFNVSIMMVSQILTEQILTEQISRSSFKEPKVKIDHSIGAWMNWSNRSNWFEYKMAINYKC